MTEQKFLITIFALSTCDECGIMAKASLVLADSAFASFDIKKVADEILTVIADAPLNGVRPMTDAEIKVWRLEKDED